MQDTTMFIRQLDSMPFDKVFDVDGNEELCHATGIEISDDGGNTWWNQYVDSTGNIHYGR